MLRRAFRLNTNTNNITYDIVNNNDDNILEKKKRSNNVFVWNNSRMLIIALVMITTSSVLVVYWCYSSSIRKGKANHSFSKTRTAVKKQRLIPNRIFFTYKLNLLHSSNDKNDEILIRTGQQQQQQLSAEELILQQNVLNTLQLHNFDETDFLTDSNCMSLIKQVMLMYPRQLDKLDDYFEREQRGMIKADICRGAALYLYGGYYFDVDLAARMNVIELLPEDTSFVVPLVHDKHKVPGSFFQAFIGVVPKYQVILRYLEFFCNYYQGRHNVVHTKSIGVVLLRHAFDDISKNMPNEVGKVIFWKEIRYDPIIFPSVEAPVGERRACQFLVIAPDDVLRLEKANGKEPTVPFYSRVQGSRMCGGEDSSRKSNRI